jgi:hypothetical protein
MWEWSGGPILLLVLLLITALASGVSCARYVRRRHLWPLSSPDATRHPLLVSSTVGLLIAWAVLHVIRAALDANMPCAAYVFGAGFILQVGKKEKTRTSRLAINGT